MEKKIKKSNNILYTGKGDSGTTTLYHCDQCRISKSSNIIEALGVLDELNAYLGLVKVYCEIDQVPFEKKSKLKIGKKELLYSSIILDIQQNIFVIQAEVGGSKMSVSKKEVTKIEKIIEEIGKVLPPINSFTISGGSVVSSSLDYARTLARKAERRLVAVGEEKIKILNKNTIAYMNRLSSLLFAMSRHANYLLSIKEEHPDYNKR